MDRKKSSGRKSRRSKLMDGEWDCSVCTFRNTAEAFKCSVCDVRKGTSTRKPKLNPQIVVAQQAAAQQQFQNPPQPKPKKEHSSVSGQSNVTATSLVGSAGLSLDAGCSSSSNFSSSSTSSTTSAGDVKEEKLVVAVKSQPGERHRKSFLGSKGGGDGEGKAHRKMKYRPKLKNVDRSSAQHKAVTVNNVTVIITEFQPKRKQRRLSSDHSTFSSSCISSSTESGNHSDSTNQSEASFSTPRPVPSGTPSSTVSSSSTGSTFQNGGGGFQNGAAFQNGGFLRNGDLLGSFHHVNGSISGRSTSSSSNGVS